MPYAAQVRQLKQARTFSRIVSILPSLTTPVLNSSELKQGFAELEALLKKQSRDDAIAIALALALSNADALVAYLRKSGLLRASRYDFNAKVIRELCLTLLQCQTALQFSHDSIKYLKSVAALHTLADEARRLHMSVLARLREREHFALKTLFATLNQLFMVPWESSKDDDASSLTHYSAEELSEALSYLLEIHRSKFGMLAKHWGKIDPKILDPLNTTYVSLLIDAARINEIKKAEVLIDGLPYEAEIQGTAVIIRSIDPALERSVRLGYVQMQQQILIRQLTVAKKLATAHKFSDFVSMIFEAGLDNFIEINPNPAPRLVFKMPDIPIIREALQSDQLFLEDALHLAVLGVGDYDSDLFKSRKITDSVTSLDLLKVARLFAFMSYVYKIKLESIEDVSERNLLTIQSVIPIISETNLIASVNWATGKENGAEIVELLSLDADRDYVDLQYTPFVRVSGHYVLQPAVIANTNIVRNIVVANKLHVSLVHEIDPMQAAVADALKEAGFMVAVEAEINIAGKQVETDIVAWRDGHLFLFECKSPYHPCGPHEMRNSFDHIDKGRKQLDLRMKEYSNPVNQQRLFSQLGWKIEATKDVHTGILTGNRVFNGFEYGIHPVRQGHEIINVLRRGWVDDGSEKRRFWNGEIFCIADLLEYLDGRSIIGDQIASMQSRHEIIVLGSKALVFETYATDLKDLLSRSRTQYPAIDTDESRDTEARSEFT
jgi:hypothetical protein